MRVGGFCLLSVVQRPTATGQLRDPCVEEGVSCQLIPEVGLTSTDRAHQALVGCSDPPHTELVTALVCVVG